MTFKLQKYTILMKYERKTEEKTANSHFFGKEKSICCLFFLLLNRIFM